MRFRIDWDSNTKMAQIDVDVNYDGVNFVSDYSRTFDGSDNSFTNGNMRIYYGGGYRIIFDDFEMVAECDTDQDGISNHLDLDSDNDGCNDVVESDGVDSDNNGILDGTGIDANGLVTGGTGGFDGLTGNEFKASQTTYVAPINQTVNDADGNTSFTVNNASLTSTTAFTGIAPNTSPDYMDASATSSTNGFNYQWYLGDPLSSGTPLANDATYSGVNTQTLNINIDLALNENQYCVIITNENYTCQNIECVTLTVNNSCDSVASGNLDNDGDGVSNLCDLDDDNDGISDYQECSLSDAILTMTGDFNATATGANPLITNDTNAGAVGNSGDVNSIQLSAFIQLSLGNAAVAESCSLTASIGEFDDGLRVDINGATVLNFNQTHWRFADEFQISGKFNSNGNTGGSFGWTPWSGEGNPELVILENEIKLFLDTKFGTREDALLFMETDLGSGNDEFILNPLILDCVTGIDFDIFNANQQTATKLVNVNLTAEISVCGDVDADGIINSFDLDSDNDGIPDAVEAGFGTSTNGRAFIQNFLDTNGNGMHDAFEGLSILDSDGDGTPNYIDLDSDNDSIFDVDESGAGNSGDGNFQNGDGDIDGDGVGDGPDSDNMRETDSDYDGVSEYFADGILDIYDFFNGNNFNNSYGNNNQGSGNTYFVLDSDADGIPDYIDVTSDGSTFDISNTLYDDFDLNNDGIIDDTNDADSDGILDLFDTADDQFGSPKHLDKKLLLYFDGTKRLYRRLLNFWR